MLDNFAQLRRGRKNAPSPNSKHLAIHVPLTSDIN